MTVPARPLASHVLRAIAHDQLRGRRARLDRLATVIGVRKKDVREVVTRLHAEGHLDATRLRLTMSGLALAVAMRRHALPVLRPANDAARLTNVA